MNPVIAMISKISMPKVAKKIRDIAVNWLFPQHLVCHCCNNEAIVNEYGVCRECENGLRRYSQASAIEFVDDYTAGLMYNDVSKQAIYRFKFNNALYVKELFMNFIRIPLVWEFDCVVPVPLHRKREKQRGYNQSAVLAKELCLRYNYIMREDLLVRISNTQSQTSLDYTERAKNVHNAFSASDDCRGLSILLVDDVRTSGATLRECARELRRHGATRVYAVTACCAAQEVG